MVYVGEWGVGVRKWDGVCVGGWEGGALQIECVGTKAETNLGKYSEREKEREKEREWEREMGGGEERERGACFQSVISYKKN